MTRILNLLISEASIVAPYPHFLQILLSVLALSHCDLSWYEDDKQVDNGLFQLFVLKDIKADIVLKIGAFFFLRLIISSIS